MSESQSRYSIVERLTNKKLGIMDDSLEYDNELENKKADIYKKEKELVTWTAFAEEEMLRQKAHKVQIIALAKKELEHLQTTKKAKEASCKLKMNELDRALKAVTEISKSSAEQAK